MTDQSEFEKACRDAKGGIGRMRWTPDGGWQHVASKDIHNSVDKSVDAPQRRIIDLEQGEDGVWHV